MSWAVLVVALAAFVLALVPTRRLFLAGWRPTPLAIYLGLLVTLAVAAVFLRAGIRVVVPVLLVLYVLPFIGTPEVVARTIARVGGGRGGPKVVEGTSRPVEEPTAEAGLVPGGRPADPDADGPAPPPGAAAGGRGATGESGAAAGGDTADRSARS